MSSPVIGYDPNSGKPVKGYDPNTGLPVFADAPTSAKPGPNASLRERTEYAAAQGDPTAQKLLAAVKQFEVGQKQDADILPYAAAAGATALTGGTALPAILAAGTGAAVGQGLKDTQWDMTPEQRAINMAKSGAGAMLTQGASSAVGSVTEWAGPKLEAAARNLWNRAAKITKPTAKTTQTMRAGGSLVDAKNEIADTVLSQGRGTLSAGNANAIREGIDALDDELSAIIQNSGKTVKRQDLRDALMRKSVEIGEGTLGQAQQQNALRSAFEELNKLPANIPVQLAQRTKQNIYKTWNYAAEAKDAAAAMADKTTGKALRASIATAEPEVAPINAELSRQIPASRAVDEAVSRTSNRDPIGLSQMVWGAVRNPATAVGAVINHPTIGSWTAQQIYRLGQALPKNTVTPANIIRVLQALNTGAKESK